MTSIRAVITWIIKKLKPPKPAHRQAMQQFNDRADSLHQTVRKLTAELHAKQPKHTHKY